MWREGCIKRVMVKELIKKLQPSPTYSEKAHLHNISPWSMKINTAYAPPTHTNTHPAPFPVHLRPEPAGRQWTNSSKAKMLSSDVSQLGFVCLCEHLCVCRQAGLSMYVCVAACDHCWKMYKYMCMWVCLCKVLVHLHHPSDVLCVALLVRLQLRACMYVWMNVCVQGWGCSSRLYTEVSTERSAGCVSPRPVSLSVCQRPWGVHSACFPLQKSVSISHLSSSQKCCATFRSLWTRQQ